MNHYIRIPLRVVSLAVALAAAPAIAAMPEAQLDELSSAASYRSDAAALNTIKNAAQAGDSAVQFALAQMYDRGSTGVPRDYVQAAAWYRKAAEQGHGEAQIGLGKLYKDGDGVPKDYAQATKWIAKAAAQGLANAQYELATLYYYQQYGQQDYDQAIAWYRKAAIQGHGRAKLGLFKALSLQAAVENRAWEITDALMSAAQSGDAKAQFNLGRIYEDGYDGPQEYAKALVWYRKAAEQGYPRAQFSLADLYLGGKGVPQMSVVAYALINVVVARHPEMSEARDAVGQTMSKKEISTAQRLSQDMMKSGNLLTALDSYVSKLAAVKTTAAN